MSASKEFNDFKKSVEDKAFLSNDSFKARKVVPLDHVLTMAVSLLDSAIESEREAIAQMVERLSPYFNEAPQASFQVDVISLAQQIRSRGGR